MPIEKSIRNEFMLVLRLSQETLDVYDARQCDHVLNTSFAKTRE